MGADDLRCFSVLLCFRARAFLEVEVLWRFQYCYYLVATELVYSTLLSRVSRASPVN
jgi:hypothetical protein